MIRARSRFADMLEETELGRRLGNWRQKGSPRFIPPLAGVTGVLVFSRGRDAAAHSLAPTARKGSGIFCGNGDDAVMKCEYLAGRVFRNG